MPRIETKIDSSSEKFQTNYSYHKALSDELISLIEKVREMGPAHRIEKHKKSDKEIRDYFIERYGEWILRAPPKQGFNLVLWILPGAGIVIGLLWVVFRSKSWVTNSQHEE